MIWSRPAARGGGGGSVADQPFQAGAVVGGDAGGRMQREAAGGEAQGCAANGFCGIGQQAAHSLSGALSSGQLSLHGGGRKGGLQGLRLGELVDLGVVEYAAALQQAHDALGGCFDDLLDVRVTQWRSRYEDRCAPVIGGYVDAVEYEDVKNVDSSLSHSQISARRLPSRNGHPCSPAHEPDGDTKR